MKYSKFKEGKYLKVYKCIFKAQKHLECFKDYEVINWKYKFVSQLI